jgi:hypothetical protein
MTMSQPFRLSLVLLAGVWAGSIHAQTTLEAQPASEGQTDPNQVVVTTNDPQQGKPLDLTRPSQDVQSLDGAGLISMSSIRKPRLLVGGTVSGGFDSNPQNLGNGAFSVDYSFSPYLGLQASTNRTQYLLQYHPTISRLTNYAGETMHLATAKVIGSISPRLSWAAGITGSHGDDSLRLLEAAQSPTIGTPGSGAFLSNAGMVTSVEGVADLHYDSAPRDSIGLHIANSYNSFSAMNQSGSVASVSLNYNHSLNPTLSLLVYGQDAQYFGDLKCTAVGAGVGLRWQFRESTLVSLKGGPQIDNPGCKSQQGFSYNASFSRELPRRSQFFVNADRQPVISFLGSGLWQDDVSGGYEREIQAANVLTFDVGFVHSSTLVSVASYHGTFFESSYTRHLRKGVSMAWTYRSFVGSSGGTGIDRNILQFALTLTPNTRTLSQ